MEPELLEVGEVQDGTRYASEHARREVARLEVDRCGAVLPGLPAASLRTANCLPADRLLLWVSIYF